MKDKHSMIFATRLKEERERKNITQTELAEFLGYKNYTTISKWESGDSLPRGKELKSLAEYFEVSADYLLGIDTKVESSSLEIIYSQLEPPRQKLVFATAEEQLEEQNSKIVRLEDHMEEKKRKFHKRQHAVDVHGLLSAGNGASNFDKEAPIKMVFLDRIPTHYDLAFEVRGDSMRPTFMDGEIVFIRKKQEIYNGMIGAVEINGEAFLKKLIEEGSRLRLISLNGNVDENGERLYPDFYADEFDDIHFIGKVLN